MVMDPDPDPAIFVCDLQQNLVFSKFFAYYFLKVHLHHFSKTTSQNSTVGIIFFSYYFRLMIEGSGSGSGSGSVSLTNGSGSGRPTNIWILRIRIRIRIRNTETTIFNHPCLIILSANVVNVLSEKTSKIIQRLLFHHI
jgi:hypothetical protein